jgi:predicted small secreted protein
MRTERGLLLLAAALILALAGCNTVEGVGMDISSGARTVGGWFGGR